MLNWLSESLQSVGSWLGEGVASILSWILSGLISVVAKILSAAGGIFDLLNAIWDFFVSIKDATLGLLPTFFPWIPAEIMTMISLALIAVLLAAIIKKVRGK